MEAVGNMGSKPAGNQAGIGRGAEAQAAAAPETARGGGLEAEPMRVGRVTAIKRPYQGQTPVQAPKNAAAVQVNSGSVKRARNRIDGARGLAETPFGGSGFKTILMKSLQETFRPASKVKVDGVTFDGEPYLVDINNSVIGKVINDKNFSAEKIALLDVLQDVVRQGEYVGSGEYESHGSKAKDTVRFDYFETPVSIGGKGYIAKFDVEAFPSRNNYKTHQLVKMELSQTAHADVGPAPTAFTEETTPAEGTRTLNPDTTIAQRADSVKFRGTDPLIQAILDNLKPAEKTRPRDVMEQEVQRLYGRRDPALSDLQELAAALQTRLAQPGTAQGWRAELEVLALYQEYLRRICGVQPAFSLLPERSGAGREGPADIEGGALVPMLTDGMEPKMEAADLTEFAELQAILEDDAPKSIAEFLDLKYNDQDGWERLKTQKEQTIFLESAPCVTTPKKYTGYFLRSGAEHANEFFDVGYTPDDFLLLRYDMARWFDMKKLLTSQQMPKEKQNSVFLWNWA